MFLGVDKLNMAKLCHRYITDYNTIKLQSDELLQIKSKVLNEYYYYKIKHVLSRYDLYEDAYIGLNLMKNIDRLIISLYNDPRIIQKNSSLPGQ